MRKVWIGTNERAPLFSPKSWTVYKRPFRTNNDLEGQNNRLKKFCRGKCLHFYRFLSVIDGEFKALTINMILASEKKIIKIRKRTEIYKDREINALSQRYSRGELTTSNFLSRMGRIYTPTL